MANILVCDDERSICELLDIALRREGQVVRDFLLHDLERGMFTREEYDQLGTVRGRMGSSFNAFSRGGVRNWRNRMRLNQLASELAFHRSVYHADCIRQNRMSTSLRTPTCKRYRRCCRKRVL